MATKSAGHPVYKVLLGGLDRGIGQELVKGIRRYCDETGEWQFYMEPMLWFLEDMKTHIAETIQQWQPDGIIALVRNPDVQRVIVDSGVVAVNLSGALDSSIPQVLVNDEAVGRLAAEHLLEQGFRSFGYCSVTEHRYTPRRLAGFRQRLAASGFSCEVIEDVQLNYAHRRAEYLERLRQWLLGLERPVGILASYDEQAQETLFECHRLGLHVPGDVALVGTGNDVSVCEMWQPALSSVELGADRLGYAGMRLLRTLLRGGAAPQQALLIDPLRVVARQSSNMLVINDDRVKTALQLIRANTDKSLSITKLASQVHLSRRAFERRFYKQVGRTPGEEIEAVRLQQAKKLLAETALPVAKIAHETGYSTGSNFHVFFKRMAGITPAEYRRRFQRTGQYRS